MIFNLKNDLTVPVSSKEEKGYYYFPAALFSLGYRIEHDFRNESMTIAVEVLRKSDNVAVLEVGCKHYDAEGRQGEQTNVKEYDAYTAELSRLTAEKEAATVEVAAAATEVADLEKQHAAAKDDEARAAIEADINTARQAVADSETEINRLTNELTKLAEVTPEYAVIETYAEIIEYFDNRMRLTEPGLAWALTNTLYDVPLADIVVTE